MRSEDLIFMPIYPNESQNSQFESDQNVMEFLPMTLDYYREVGFSLPWVSYVVKFDDNWVGSGAFKGAPNHGEVEIAYVVYEPFRKLGIGRAIAEKLVHIAKEVDSSVIVKARTLPERNYSTRILEKIGFELVEAIEDPEDGLVWEWRYIETLS